MKKTHNIWLSTWIWPKATGRRVVEANPSGFGLFFAIVYGIIIALSWFAEDWNLSHDKTHFDVTHITLNLLQGIVLGIITLYLGSLILKWTGNWLNGKGTYVEVKSVFGWSLYPFIISAILGLISQLFIGTSMTGHIIFNVLGVIAFIWAVVILIFMLTEAHRFSALRSFIAFIIAAIIALIISFLVTYIINLFARG